LRFNGRSANDEAIVIDYNLFFLKRISFSFTLVSVTADAFALFYACFSVPIKSLLL